MDEKKKKIIFAADHAGYELKEKLKSVLEENEIPFEDVSPEMVKDDVHDGFISLDKARKVYGLKE